MLKHTHTQTQFMIYLFYLILFSSLIVYVKSNTKMTAGFLRKPVFMSENDDMRIERFEKCAEERWS